MIELRESDIKATCESFLYSLMNMDKLIYLRLNSGDLIIGEGKTKRRVRCCPMGTSDGLVMIDRGIYNIFVEYKRPVGGKQTREQLAFEKKVEGMGFEYWIVKDSEAFVEAIREII
jgi:hypothetical protein